MLTVLSVADVWITWAVLDGGGSELNPGIALLLGGGWWPVLAVKAVSVVAGWCLWSLSGRYVLAGSGLRVVTWALAVVVGYEAMGVLRAL